jgi:putative transposase
VSLVGAGPLENRLHAGIGLHTPASVHYGTATEICAARAETLTAAYDAKHSSNPRKKLSHPP